MRIISFHLISFVQCLPIIFISQHIVTTSYPGGWCSEATMLFFPNDYHSALLAFRCSCCKCSSALLRLCRAVCSARAIVVFAAFPIPNIHPCPCTLLSHTSIFFPLAARWSCCSVSVYHSSGSFFSSPLFVFGTGAATTLVAPPFLPRFKYPLSPIHGVSFAMRSSNLRILSTS